MLLLITVVTRKSSILELKVSDDCYHVSEKFSFYLGGGGGGGGVHGFLNFVYSHQTRNFERYSIVNNERGKYF